MNNNHMSVVALAPLVNDTTLLSNTYRITSVRIIAANELISSKKTPNDMN